MISLDGSKVIKKDDFVTALVYDYQLDITYTITCLYYQELENIVRKNKYLNIEHLYKLEGNRFDSYNKE